MVGGERPLLPEIWVNLAPLEQNRRFSVDIHSLRLNGIALSKKVQLTLIGSPLCAFQ